MPWATPTLKEVRGLVRDSIRGRLPGADAVIPNSVLRVLSDSQGALCHLTLQYIDWLALQLLPDTAETEWLDRHGDIWLVNSDGTTGRKLATLAEGIVTISGTVPGTPLPIATRLSGINFVDYETTETVYVAESQAPVPVNVRALDPGSAGNATAGDGFVVQNPPVGVDGSAVVVEITGGADTENDDDLRERVLARIRQPPMGGDLTDYIAWAEAVPGVTRAWCAPLEQGIGTVTVRFMMDDLRAEFQGFPSASDVTRVKQYIDTVRPVAVKEVYVVAPIPQRVDVFIQDLVPDTTAIRSAIEASLEAMILQWAKPGQPIYAAWKYYAIQNTPGVEHFDLLFTQDDYMPSPGHLPVLGDVVYSPAPPTFPSTGIGTTPQLPEP